jgi:hypothetical protein
MAAASCLLVLFDGVLWRLAPSQSFCAAKAVLLDGGTPTAHAVTIVQRDDGSGCLPGETPLCRWRRVVLADVWHGGVC